MEHCERLTAGHLEQVAGITLRALERSRMAWLFAGHKRIELRKAITETVRVVQDADPSDYSEQQISLISGKLSILIDGLERYQTARGDEDLTLCRFIGDSVKTLREARHWIAQGLSPNPSKRPTQDKMDALADEVAADAFKALFG